MARSVKKAGNEAQETLADRVQRSRRALGMTRAQLASSAKLPRAPVSRYENKQTKDMSVRILGKLANALGVSADYLAGRREDEAYFRNPRLQRLIKSMKGLKEDDLQCMHELYLFLLEKHR